MPRLRDDLDSAGVPQLAIIATRGLVQTGDNVMIAAELKAALQRASKETESSISARTLANLAELAKTGNPDIVVDLVTFFAESTPPLLAKARLALENSSQLKIIAHQRKLQ